MYPGQLNNSDADKGYDFTKEENAAKWNGVFINSLEKVLKQVHPSLSAQKDALYYVESLCLRLLAMLCAKPSPHTVSDIAERVNSTFPNPIETWALQEARDTIDKYKKKKLVLPVEKIHGLLHKDVFQYKIESTVSTFMVAVLEYISADILKLAGNYVKNIRHVEISREDIEIAMCADKVLMDMFYQGESGNSSITPSPLPPTPRDSLTYEEVVKELIHEEKQYQRDLHMIIRVFRAKLAHVVKDTQELDAIFGNISEIYELTVTLLGSLEDVIEMSQEQTPPLIGNCFEELAEAEEFAVYIRYAEEIHSAHSRDTLQNLLARSDTAKLVTAGHGFREAVKYYLPKLLLGPIWHAYLYLEYVESLLKLSPNKEDRESFEQVQGLLKPMQRALNSIAATLPKEYMVQGLSRTRRQPAIDKVKELQNTVENWDKDLAGTNCNEFIRVDTLQLVSGKRITERKLYLFDGLLVLCKANARRQAVTVVTTNHDFRLKEKFHMRRVEVIDRPDTDELRHAFEISPRGNNQGVVLVAKTEQQKNDWMADLIMVTTKSMLDRILDSIMLEIEKNHPLQLPSPEIYKFAVPDSPNNIVLEERESTGVPLIKGATICKLIERLTYHIYADPMFVRTFLTTYRSFCSPHELLRLLIERFDIPDPSVVYDMSGNGGDKDLETDKIHKNLQREDWKRYKKEYVQPVQFRVLNVLRHWVDHHFYDFENDLLLLEQLLQFLETVSGKSMRKWVDSVLKIVQRKKEQEANHKQITFAFGHSPPAIEYHLQVPDEEMNLLTLHPLELARQLTLLEFELYKTVKPSELVGSVWTKEDKEKSSPNLLKIIKHTTNFTRWLEKSILDAENFEERVAMMSRAIEIMMVLLELNNFNGVLSVVAAIAGAAVFRLKCTLQAITARHRASLDECRALTDDHYRRYQEKLRSINPPCVPFFGMYLTNILHIEDGNLDHLPNTDLINFSKRRKVADIIGEIQQYQNQPYCLKLDPKIRNFLENLDPYEGKTDLEISNYFWSESSRIEPKDVRPLPKFPRKWPDINLKSPGIKPRRHNQSSSNSNNSISMPGTLPFSSKSHHSIPPSSSSEMGDQSPTGNYNNHSSQLLASSLQSGIGAGGGASSSSSAHEFSVFANVNIQGSSQSLFSQSQANLTSSTISTSVTDFSDTISLSSAIMAPELPKRSNSIISLSNNSVSDSKPILSPRSLDHQQQQLQFLQQQQYSGMMTTSSSRHQPIVSPKCLLDMVKERTGGGGGSGSGNCCCSSTATCSMCTSCNPEISSANIGHQHHYHHHHHHQQYNHPSHHQQQQQHHHHHQHLHNHHQQQQQQQKSQQPPAISPRTDKLSFLHQNNMTNDLSGGGGGNVNATSTPPSLSSDQNNISFQNNNTSHQRHNSTSNLRNSIYSLNSNGSTNQYHQQHLVFPPTTTVTTSTQPPHSHYQHHHNNSSGNSSNITNDNHNNISSSSSSTSSTSSTTTVAAAAAGTLSSSTTIITTTTTATTTTINYSVISHSGPIPISPHVNVPNFYSYNHPPPLPPRRRERKVFDVPVEQAPDAPQLPRREQSPPPLPPRTWTLQRNIDLSHCGDTSTSATVTLNNHHHHTYDQGSSHKMTCKLPSSRGGNNDSVTSSTSLQLINSSTIMMRRSSALERNSREGSVVGLSPNILTPSSPNSGGYSQQHQQQHQSDETTSNLPNHNTAPPVTRRPSTSTSPRFSPGETTPILPPKPRNSNLLAHTNATTLDRGGNTNTAAIGIVVNTTTPTSITSATIITTPSTTITMFPYPSPSNHE